MVCPRTTASREFAVASPAVVTGPPGANAHSAKPLNAAFGREVVVLTTLAPPPPPHAASVRSTAPASALRSPFPAIGVTVLRGHTERHS